MVRFLSAACDDSCESDKEPHKQRTVTAGLRIIKIKTLNISAKYPQPECTRVCMYIYI